MAELKQEYYPTIVIESVSMTNAIKLTDLVTQEHVRIELESLPELIALLQKESESKEKGK